MLTEKDDQQESQSQEFEVLDVQPKITSHLSSSRDKQMINLGDDIEEYGKLEGGGNYSYPDPITISSEDDEDPLTNGPKTQTSRSDKAQSPDAEYCLEKEEEVDELSTDSDTPQVKETSALNLRPRVASPDLGAKQTYIAKKKVTPITGTMKKSEKERREERTRRLQEERLNRRMNKYIFFNLGVL